MILPNAKDVFIPLEKLTEYSLNFNHPEGKHKARMFESTLGLTLENVSELISSIREAVLKEPVISVRKNLWGIIYTVDFRMVFKHKTATVRTGWIIDKNNKNPRLISCYVKK